MTDYSLNDHLSGKVTATVHCTENILPFRNCVWIVGAIPDLAMTNKVNLSKQRITIIAVFLLCFHVFPCETSFRSGYSKEMLEDFEDS